MLTGYRVVAEHTLTKNGRTGRAAGRIKAVLEKFLGERLVFTLIDGVLRIGLALVGCGLDESGMSGARADRETDGDQSAACDQFDSCRGHFHPVYLR